VDVVDKKERWLSRRTVSLPKASIKKLLDNGVTAIPTTAESLVGKFASTDIVDPETGEVILECNQELTAEKIDELRHKGVNSFKLLYIDGSHVTSSFRDTLLADKISSNDEALIEIYRRLRPGDPPTLKSSLALFDNLFSIPNVTICQQSAV